METMILFVMLISYSLSMEISSSFLPSAETDKFILSFYVLAQHSQTSLTGALEFGSNIGLKP